MACAACGQDSLSSADLLWVRERHLELRRLLLQLPHLVVVVDEPNVTLPRKRAPVNIRGHLGGATHELHQRCNVIVYCGVCLM